MAICELDEHSGGSETISVRVHPSLVPISHPLALVRDSFNAVFVTGDAVGELMFYGRGAGGSPTASAVLGDIIDAAHNLSYGVTERQLSRDSAAIVDIATTSNSFYVALDVEDRPGVLAQVASIFGRNLVSIYSMEQEGKGDEARLVFITHTAPESALHSTLEELGELETVKRVAGFIRVFDAK